MSNIAKIEIEKGTELLPTILKIQFSPNVWNFAFHQGRMERLPLTEKEAQDLEVREAVRKCAYMIERELREAVKQQLGVKL